MIGTDTTYQRVPFRDEDDDPNDVPSTLGSDNNNNNNNVNVNVNSNSNSNNSGTMPPSAMHDPLRNFLAMSVLFSANHGCVVSCLALASARLGTIGAWQSGLLMFSYASSALLGATYAVKTLGARNSLTLGMLLYCAYVACFWVAGHLEGGDMHSHSHLRAAVAYTGALVGGIGAGFLWTAQGTYFGLASQDHAVRNHGVVEDSTAKLAGYFASLYLLEELVLRLLSSALLEWEVASWGTIFGIYTLVAVLSTAALPCCVYDYPSTGDESNSRESNSRDNSNSHNSNSYNSNNSNSNSYNSNSNSYNSNSNNSNSTGVVDSKNSVFYKATVAFYVLLEDPKMKYMIGLNAVFGFVSAFLNSYVNGQVVPVALNDPDSKYIGVLNSMVSAVAASASLFFGKLTSNKNGDGNGNGNGNGNNHTIGFGGIIGTKEAILCFGALCFGGVVLPFVVQPDAGAYGWTTLIVVYALHGLGRATFEGTLRSTFADYFSYEKEGAFANIILQNGIASGVGYILTFALTCETPSRYCVRYSNGSLHDVLTFELVALVSVVVAVGGFLRASKLHREELRLRRDELEMRADEALLEPHASRNGVSA
eukprot:CAMPEP_0172380280 /NCGR_PEP_ID=MMETSP1060-20121228/70356_1 /TAXON_ID=37318 /ORGANISM="Pseudo-nitzschia pungens, Strain cf. cingulata" /LENGTH=593 /DNA_ID=CAMNT_0013108033 /DNA_START=295 /DNA_END=2076 /DNA_ORIENTATION=-